MPAQIVVASDHAIAKHGYVMAASAANCFNGQGVIRAMRRRPSDNKIMKACEMGGFWFIGIFFADGSNDSMYQKDGSWNVNSIRDYIDRAGFTSRP